MYHIYLSFQTETSAATSTLVKNYLKIRDNANILKILLVLHEVMILVLDECAVLSKKQPYHVTKVFFF